MMRRRADILVEIDRLAYGGEGVGRDANGRVVFVPRTAPGDVARVVIHHERARFAKGKMTSLVTPGPARIEPACPYFQECGGCSWQHVAYEAQATAKQAAAAFALRRFVANGTTIDWVGMANITGWRRRARFHFRRTEESLYVGFFAPQTHRVVDIEACLQLTPALSGLLATLRRELAGIEPSSGDIHVLEGMRGELHVALVGIDDREILQAVLAHPGVVGVSGQRHDNEAHLGQAQVEIDPGIFAGARDFAQAGREANDAMRCGVLEAAGEGRGRDLLELFAGSGNFSVPLRDAGWQVLANDLSTPRGLAGVRFVAQDAVAFAAQLVGEGRQFSAIVLDPPRAGALAVVEQLPALGAQTIVYVSCDVMTFARDAAVLLANGFTLPHVLAIDTMPQTSHFEVIAKFVRLPA